MMPIHESLKATSLYIRLTGLPDDWLVKKKLRLFFHSYFPSLLADRFPISLQPLPAELTLEPLDQLGHNLIQITDDTVVGDLEDRSVFVIIDGDDYFGIHDPHGMLDLSRYADSEVQVWAGFFARKTYHLVFREPVIFMGDRSSATQHAPH
jgi:hypothetical protein